MKHRVSHSVLMLCALLLVTALLAGISPASYAAPLQRDAFAHMNRTMTMNGTPDTTVPSEPDAEVQAEAASEADEETPLKERLLKDELLKEQTDESDAEDALPEDALPEDALPEDALPEVALLEDALPEEVLTEPVLEENAGDTSDTAESALIGTISPEDILKANDYYALTNQFGGYGLITDVDPAFSAYWKNSLWYVTDSLVYFEYPAEDAWDTGYPYYDDYDLWDDPVDGDDDYWDGFDWDRFDWNSFDWENFDWENNDWEGFFRGILGALDTGNGDSMNCDGDDFFCGDMFWNEPTRAVMHTAKDSFELAWYSDDDTEFAVTWYAYPGEEMSVDLWDVAPKLDLGYLDITDVRMEDGLLVVTMVGDGSYLPEEIQLEELRSGQIRETFYLDAETGLIQYIVSELILPDGTEMLMSTETMFYEEPDSEVYNAMLQRAAVYDQDEFENPRTVTVVYDPGTELEETCTRTVESGDFLNTYFLEGYAFYEDAEGTIPFTGGDGIHDLTVYGIYEDDLNWEWGPWIVEDDTVLYDAPFEDVIAPDGTEDATVPEGPKKPVFKYEKDQTAAPDGTEDAPASEEPQKPVFKYEKDQTVAPDETEDAPAPEEPKKPVFKYENDQAAAPDGTEDAPAPEEPKKPVFKYENENAEAADPTPDADANTVDQGINSFPDAFDQEVEVVIGDTWPVLDLAAISDAIYEANTLDAIFSRHESVEYWILFDEDKLPSEYYDYIYETPDTAYSETKDAAFYADRNSFYQLWLDGSDSDLYYTFDFINGYDPHRNAGYQIVPAAIEEWWDSTHEDLVDAYEVCGEVCLVSEYDEALSRRFIEDCLQEAYDGQLVSVTVIADAESYEIITLDYEVTDTEGNVSYPMTFVVDYDSPEPRACRNMRAIADRSAEKTADLTIIMNPGEESETVESMTVPIGSEVVCITLGEYDLYDDPDCTVPSGRWDKISDHVFYMIPSFEAV